MHIFSLFTLYLELGDLVEGLGLQGLGLGKQRKRRISFVSRREEK